VSIGILHEQNNYSRKRLKLAGILGLAGAVGAIFFLTIFISLHWLDPSVDIARNYVSDYANGEYGRLFQVSTFMHGISNLAIAGGLALIVNTCAGRYAAALFGLASIAIVIASIFSTDPVGELRTATGIIHLAASIAVFLLETLALFIFAYAFRDLILWRSFARVTIVIAVFSVVFLLWLLSAVIRGLDPGLPERASFLAFMTWEILAGLYLAIRMHERLKTKR
jgi:hypothetical membrane protein